MAAAQGSDTGPVLRRRRPVWSAWFDRGGHLPIVAEHAATRAALRDFIFGHPVT